MSFQRAARTDKGVSAAGQAVSLKMSLVVIINSFIFVSVYALFSDMHLPCVSYVIDTLEALDRQLDVFLVETEAVSVFSSYKQWAHANCLSSKFKLQFSLILNKSVT